jgi:hypothetical protein
MAVNVRRANRPQTTAGSATTDSLEAMTIVTQTTAGDDHPLFNPCLTAVSDLFDGQLSAPPTASGREGQG